jgi:hypothetical protein
MIQNECVAAPSGPAAARMAAPYGVLPVDAK